ncbi:DUF4349 domain-containing protein [Cellulomonas soli]|uniref:DUF4349 domain-containing protein n=1 Tax=Cellulomonas soli TaxID=931535 RepID=A0A512P885_9CELL|nr:DUF4349 domain-containing protein [Cellulomonas soli]NYI57640.1 hypothetical protein [Cellulomonas soli]GEP67418.1 hypothetical protein CSO01_01330 [Cellulomonas soli]
MVANTAGAPRDISTSHTSTSEISTSEIRRGAHPASASPGTARSRVRQRWAGIVALLVVTGTLAACSASGGDASTDSGAVPGVAGAEAVGAADSAGSDVAAGDEAAVAATDRQVVQTGTVWMTAPDPVAAAEAVVALAEGLEGRVDDRHSVAGDDERDASASLVVRVPAADLTTMLEGLADVGRVVEQEVQAQDVTADAQDLDARIHALELSVARMEDLLGRATSNADLVAAEQALSERQANLESLRSQRARLAEEVALSTLTIQVDEPGEVPATTAPAPDGFLGGLAVGWSSLVTMLSGAVLVLGVLAPWLAFGGAVAAGCVAVVRWWRRRSGTRAGGPAGAPPVAGAAAPGEDG